MEGEISMSEDKTEDAAMQNVGVQNIDQIREIILGPQMRNIGDLMFGSQLRELEKRFVKLEKSIVDESDTLRSEISSRLDVLESYIKREVGSVAESIATERREREEASSQFTYELSKYANDTDKKVKLVEEKLEQSKAESRNALLDQSKSLLSELQTVRISVTELLNKNIENIHADKPDREMLADLFHELSLRLSGDTKQQTDK